MRRILTSGFLLILFVLPVSFAHGFGAINGPDRVALGSVQTYSVYFSYGHVPNAISWSVYGATKIEQGDFTATIQLGTTLNSVYIVANNSITGEQATFSVNVGYPDVSPLTQQISYGGTPQPLSVVWPGGIVPPGNLQYQWQEYIGGNYYPISNAISNSYAPQALVSAKTYRCSVSGIDGWGSYPFYTRNSEITIGIFYGGWISLQQQPVYNTAPQITTSPATGGPCNPSTYVYHWERSVENGPWEIIGTGENSPFGNQPVTGKWHVRRKITCGSESLYSNTLLVTPTAYTPADFENRTYVREYSVVVKGYKTFAEVDQLPIGKKFVSTAYTDGLGRPVQQIEKQVSYVSSSNTWNDWVQYTEYDGLGRTPKSFLPYSASNETGKFKTDAASAQPNYILQKYNDAKGYSLVQYDNSPLNIIVKSFGPGADWIDNNKGASVEYNFNNLNTSQENVRVWNIGYSAGSIPVSLFSDVYTDGKLNKTTTYDENNKKVIEYTDFSGNVVLKKVQDKEDGQGLTNQHTGWACTYYVYDDFNRLRFVIPPKAVEWLDINTWQLSSNNSIINDLCYWYEYDKESRMIAKKTPNAEPFYFVYDTKDRLVFSQNGRQRPGKWMTNLYDVLNRIVVTGEISYSGSRNDLQLLTNNIIADAPVTQNIITNQGSSSYTVNINLNPLPAGHNLYVHTITCYDKYDYPLVKNFTTNFQTDNTVPADESEEINTTQRVKNAVTGTFVRILDGSNKFLLSTQFYDDKLRPIQTHTENIFGNTDIITVQYDFSGKVRSSYTTHTATLQTNPTVVIAPIQIFNKSYFDKIGRVIKISETINGNPEKFLAEYNYNASGQVNKKRLAPGFTGDDGPELETLEYDYNIRGWLTGINKNYVNSTYQQGRYFGMEFGYQKTGTNFSKQEWNGNVSGIKWKSRGDNIQRRYEYTYDNLNQLKDAVFKQKNTAASGWTNDKVDFTTQITYYTNGNIKTVNQWGIVPGVGVTQVDQLAYTYDNNGYSNKLLRVDEGVTGAWNGKLGDFKNGTNGNGATDYVYDVNGNIVKDLNKEMEGAGASDGIEYNILELPSKITFKNTGKTISYIYDAVGTKLKKIVNEPVSGNPPKTTETNYIGDFIYESGVLQFFSHSEGRVRIITPASENNGLSYLAGGISLPGGKQGVYDYYIKDHLTNIRMILTEEQHQVYAKATMEDAAATTEEAIFGQQPPGTNELAATRSPKYPAWTSNSSQKVSQLSSLGTGKKIGPNTLLRVMAGDYVSAKTLYYYDNPVSSSSSVLNDVVNSIIGTITSTGKTGSLIKGNSNFIQNNIGSPAGPLGTFLSNQPNGAVANQPKAFITVLFFDEQFNFIAENSGYEPVRAAGMQGNPPKQQASRYVNILRQAPQNGYVMVYVSNESPVNVYFDDFEVTHTRGRIIEENHYYAYGLKIAGISGKAVPSGFPGGAQANSRATYGYQGDFSEEDTDAQWNEFALRTYDPQTGRWLQIDPEDIFTSPYIGMANNPVSSVDPMGASPYDWFSYRGADGYLHVAWSDNVIDQATAVAEAQRLGGYGGDYIGKSGYWFSNEDGPTYWRLLDKKVHYRISESEYENGTYFLRSLKKEATSTATISQWDGVRSSEKTFAAGWERFNNNPWSGALWPANELSKAAYGTLDAFKIFGTQTLYGWKNATNLKGENLLQEYGGNASFKMRYFATVSVLSTPFGAIGAETNAATKTGGGNLDGSFSIWNWEGYPAGIPKPKGPFKLIHGQEYSAARTAADKANKALGRELNLQGRFVDVHEITPVKFNGSPTNLNNKIFVDRSFHQTQINPFWDKIKKGIQ